MECAKYDSLQWVVLIKTENVPSGQHAGPPRLPVPDLSITRTMLRFETEPLPSTLQIRVLDGHTLHQASHCTKPLRVTTAYHYQEWLSFLVIPFPLHTHHAHHCLCKHNPHIDWTNGHVLDWVSRPLPLPLPQTCVTCTGGQRTSLSLLCAHHLP